MLTSTPESTDTIVALSTPPGRGGIGIVRLSGPAARAIAEPLLRLRHALAHAQVRLAQVLDSSGAVLDEAVVTYFAAPRSYTTQDVVEIATHGSPVLLDHLLRRCLERGARLAEPGEFTQRAFLAGRLDLTQAEAVRDLIESQTLEQARQAAQQLDGSIARTVAPIKQQLIGLIAALEAGVDFAEDDVDVMPADEITQQIAAVERPLRQLAQSFAYGRVLRNGITLAIAGRPNAGKSSLFNRLVQRERAIVTAAPGTTRDLVTEQVALGGIPLQLVDTAGLRSATESPADEAEALGIAKSREAIAEADLILLVRDSSLPPAPEDDALLHSLAGRPLLLVLNKCDLPPAPPPEHAAPPPAAGSLPAVPTLFTSATTGTGVDALRQAILQQVAARPASAETALLTNLRQQQAVTAATAALQRAAGATRTGTPHEVLLIDLYEALQSLDSLTGATTPDDILHRIFHEFCIGK
ncbi:MAG: tRNA uridine-5-carboxymethylaminomethyl(34) synthesis GTPase MnmE [Acidobacteriota bacterium]|nr:tRNA uridine-5-carboxymethylaminomethyl(34) synthesis GTPase MnmE [Acidobacteriota bacterium]